MYTHWLYSAACFGVALIVLLAYALLEKLGMLDRFIGWETRVHERFVAFFGAVPKSRHVELMMSYENTQVTLMHARVHNAHNAARAELANEKAARLERQLFELEQRLEDTQVDRRSFCKEWMRHLMAEVSQQAEEFKESSSQAHDKGNHGDGWYFNGKYMYAMDMRSRIERFLETNGARL